MSIILCMRQLSTSLAEYRAYHWDGRQLCASLVTYTWQLDRHWCLIAVGSGVGAEGTEGSGGGVGAEGTELEEDEGTAVEDVELEEDEGTVVGCAACEEDEGTVVGCAACEEDEGEVSGAEEVTVEVFAGAGPNEV